MDRQCSGTVSTVYRTYLKYSKMIPSSIMSPYQQFIVRIYDMDIASYKFKADVMQSLRYSYDNMVSNACISLAVICCLRSNYMMMT